MRLCINSNCYYLGICILAVCVFLLPPIPAFAGLLVDDFTETSGNVSYPIVNQFPAPVFPDFDSPLISTFGNMRILVVAPGPEIPFPDPFPDDVSLSVDINTTLGLLTSTASADSTTFLVLSWGSSPDPVNADVTGDTHLAIDYSSSVDFDLVVTLSNLDSNGATEGANRATLTLPAGTSERLLVALADIDEDVPDLLNQPNVFPPVDLTSLDGVLLDFQTVSLGAELTLSQVAFLNVPEPATGGSLIVGLALFGLRSRRRYPAP